jgi:dTDP-glucose pyrophosphorylase
MAALQFPCPHTRSTTGDTAVVLARGLGTRMRRPAAAAALDDRQAAVADTGVKALLPVGRPFLDYVLAALADAGYRRACLVVGPEHDTLRDYYTRQSPPRRLEVAFAVQPLPRGTADAVAAVESLLPDEPFTVLNSDNYYPAEALAALRQQPGCATALFDWQSLLEGSNIPAERLRHFAVAEIDGDGLLRRIIEKPDEPTWAALPRPLWISMNCWRFTPTIFRACRAIGPSPRGEYEIPTAVQYAITVLGAPFHTVTVRAAVLDLSTRNDIGPVTALLAHRKVDL